MSSDLRPTDAHIEVARHILYARVRAFLVEIEEGSEGDEAAVALRCLDALYVSSGRSCIGPVDGDPDRL